MTHAKTSRALLSGFALCVAVSACSPLLIKAPAAHPATVRATPRPVASVSAAKAHPSASPTVTPARPASPSPQASDTPVPVQTVNPTPTETASATPSPSATEVSSPSTAPGAVIFSDDFDGAKGSAPDPTKWADYSACTYNGSAAFGDIGCGNNETLDGAGDLVIPATPTAGSAIRTTSTYAFEYGVFSAWIKAPSQVGYWPAFWTLNNGWDGTNHSTLGEADAMEGYTTWHSLYHATGHNWSNTDSPSSSGADNVCGGADLSAAFHKYSVKIAPGQVTFYLDDVQCGSELTPATNPGEPYGFGPSVTSGNWMILDLAVGGAGGQQQPATQPAQMLVSRVEIRNLP